MNRIVGIDLGIMDYREAFDFQCQLMDDLKANTEKKGYLLFVEHPSVYTLGTVTEQKDFLIDPELLKNSGFDIVHTNRGGKITYHGLGQQVVYPILNLRYFNKDIKWYVDFLEEWIIQSLLNYGISSGRKPEYRGVWVGERKICALGVAVKHWICMHGIGLNNYPDMLPFNYIIPCGISEYGVTSIAKEGVMVSMDELRLTLIKEFEALLECEINMKSKEEVLDVECGCKKTGLDQSQITTC